jgi:Periplasmic copper-binding protein (NosD)
MYKHWILSLLTSATIAASTPAHAKQYQVGGCIANLVSFTTIQAAVSSVPPGSTIQVCPGTYFEQVTISQPLTLKGADVNNLDRPVIAAPPNGLAINVTSITGAQVAAQVLVENVSPPGKVVLTGITVDGSLAEVPGCSVTAFLAGIFYASGTSGTIEDMTTRYQQLPSCGYGIWIENGAGPNQSITVEDNSVHDMTWVGVYAVSNQTPPTLTATIKGNFVNGQVYNQTRDIWVEDISGALTDNVVTGGLQGISSDTGAGSGGPVTISGNALADISIGVGIAIGDGTTVTSNKISNVHEAFAFGGSGVSPGPTVTGNTTQNTTLVIEYNCIPNVTVKSNTFNDSTTGFDQIPSANSGLGKNTIDNIDTLQTSSCP